MSFSTVSSRYAGPQLEQRILDFWRDKDVFAQTLSQSEGRPLFTFNESEERAPLRSTQCLGKNVLVPPEIKDALL